MTIRMRGKSEMQQMAMEHMRQKYRREMRDITKLIGARQMRKRQKQERRDAKALQSAES